uniref:Microtubule interacting and trafficking domain containing 1 n=1 Tax=Nothoprocta perdicaria TaxID=30464 RepID=A0A8C6YLG1_NOTPE
WQPVGKLQGPHSTGKRTVRRAVELDVASRFQESLVCYQEGIDLLLQVVKEQQNYCTHRSCLPSVSPPKHSRETPQLGVVILVFQSLS